MTAFDLLVLLSSFALHVLASFLITAAIYRCCEIFEIVEGTE